MNDKLHIEIVTPYELFFEGDADQLILPALDGEIGVRPGHAPFIVALTPGELRMTIGEETFCAAVSDGYAQIEVDNAIVVLGSAERPEQIDRERAERSLYRAQKRIQDPSTPENEVIRSRRGLLRAKARIKLSEKFKQE